VREVDIIMELRISHISNRIQVWEGIILKKNTLCTKVEKSLKNNARTTSV